MLAWGEVFAPSSVDAGDFDGDGDIDVISGDYFGSSWYENLGNGFAPLVRIDTVETNDVSTCDLDLDGKLDVLVAGSNGMVWHRGTGTGSFGAAELITDKTDGANGGLAVDLDSDGISEVLFTSFYDHQLSWCDNLLLIDCNGNGTPDPVDIASGTSLDCNGNGVPDECDLLGPYADIDGDGQLDSCVPPALLPDVFELSLSAGGIQNFAISAPTAGDAFLLLGTLSGTSPGTPSGGLIVPLNVDGYTLHTALSPNRPPLTGSFGVLFPDGSGGGIASAAFTLPPATSPGLVGATAHHAFVTFQAGTGALNFVSNAAPLLLAP